MKITNDKFEFTKLMIEFLEEKDEDYYTTMLCRNFR